jgi:hypothetical protein
MNIDLQAWQKIAELKVIAWWNSLTYDDFYNAWLVVGVVLFLFLAWLSHLIMRKTLGHRKFRGTWYNVEQYETLIKMIDEDSTRGNRVMKADEMKELRIWRFGSAKNISSRTKGYF